MSDVSLKPAFAWWLVIHCFNTKLSLSLHRSPVLLPVLTELVAHGPTSSVKLCREGRHQFAASFAVSSVARDLTDLQQTLKLNAKAGDHTGGQ